MREIPDRPLRFAPLARVSSERAEKQGESITVQKSQIEQAVKALNGVLISDPWRYSGQEHATPQFERQRFDRLLKDTGKGIFDAVIVVDPSRWSRDNLRSKQGLQILRDNNIRFFTLQIEHDLFDEQAQLFLGMATEFNEYWAKIQTKKSMRSRIARALRNLASLGKLPHGRTFDKKTETWGIDGKKQEKIQWAADQYLKGEQIPKIAKTLGMNHANLFKILTQRSGDTWEVEFKSKQHAIDEKVTLKVPALLEPEIIKRIHAKAEANKTYTHGEIKYQYLLSRLVFCSKCGLSLFGQTNHNERRYYRHSRNLENRKCDKGIWIPAEQLEQDVLIRIFATLGDPAGMERAMEKAIPNRAKIKELRERKRFLEAELSKVEAGKKRVIDRIEEGVISKDETAGKMTEIRERESSIKAEIDGIEPQLSDVPSEEEIKRKAKMIQRIVSQIYRTPSRLKKMTFEERRKLVNSFFAGKDSKGRRLGVYISGEKKGITHYEIRGMFQSFKGTLGDLDLPNVNIEHLEDLKQAVHEKPGKCHAYHRLGLYQR